MIELDKVASVYSGIAGRCCCGCAGKYRYASKYRDWAGKDRGYAIEDSEINDSEVRRIVHLLNANRPWRAYLYAASEADMLRSGMISKVIGKRLYIAYVVFE